MVSFLIYYKDRVEMKELKDKNEQYNQYLYRHSRKNSKAKNSFGKMIVGLLLTIMVVIAAAFAFIGYAGVDNKYSKMLLSFVEDINPKEQKGFSLPILQQKQNILIVGVDSNGDNADKFKGTRSDTMILVNLDPASHSINAISIPRDSKVYLAGDHGVQKINAAHALGGIDLTIKTVEDTLGIKINKYVVVNNDGVKKLVDALGGVPVYIEKDMTEYLDLLKKEFIKAVLILPFNVLITIAPEFLSPAVTSTDSKRVSSTTTT